MSNPAAVLTGTGLRSALQLAVPVLVAAALAFPALAQEDLTPPEQKLEDVLILADTYQACYFDLVSVSCFQLYSSTGIIATDFARGNITAPTALDALDHNFLLLAACLTSLERVGEVTPADDTVAQAEIARLDEILSAENELLTALNEVIIDPSDRTEAVVESCRQRVEAALDEYVTVVTGE